MSFEEFKISLLRNLAFEIADEKLEIKVDDRLIEECYKELIENGVLTVNDAMQILVGRPHSDISFGRLFGWEIVDRGFTGVELY